MVLDTQTGATRHDESAEAVSTLDARARRRALGAYYTPDRLSTVVTEWAIKRLDDRVLEPGFGGCGFLVAAKLRLEALGQHQPDHFIHGCDVDDEAFGHLKQVFHANPSPRHFPKTDFLDTAAGTTWGGRRFRVALGNPPYVSYQALGDKRDHYQGVLARSGWSGLSGRASLWAYFVLHALTFLEQGGRIAWVLPGSLMRANYARFVKEVIASRFGKAALFHVHERLFTPAGAEEETVILAATDFGHEGDGPLREYYVERVYDLGRALHDWEHGRLPPTQRGRSAPLAALGRLEGLENIALGDLLTARIGVVTGNNKFFLFSKQRAEDEGIPLDLLQPILAKGSMAPGLTMGRRELNAAREAGLACYLISSPSIPASNASITAYLKSYPKVDIAQVSTFKKRRNWHEPADQQIPDAFWPVMRDLGPKLILNPLGLHCTNTLHRLFFKDCVTQRQRKVIAIALQSTYAQLQAELCGRSYGAGVLKHEPRDVEKIIIPWPKKVDRRHTDRTFQRIDQALRSDRALEAMRLADSYIARYAKAAYGVKHRESLKTALDAMRRVRLPAASKRAASPTR